MLVLIVYTQFTRIYPSNLQKMLPLIRTLAGSWTENPRVPGSIRRGDSNALEVHDDVMITRESKQLLEIIKEVSNFILLSDFLV